MKMLAGKITPIHKEAFVWSILIQYNKLNFCMKTNIKHKDKKVTMDKVIIS